MSYIGSKNDFFFSLSVYLAFFGELSRIETVHCNSAISSQMFINPTRYTVHGLQMRKLPICHVRFVRLLHILGGILLNLKVSPKLIHSILVIYSLFLSVNLILNLILESILC